MVVVANVVEYVMKVVGSEKDVLKLHDLLTADYNYRTGEFTHDRHFFRIFDVWVVESGITSGGSYYQILGGSCAWSAGACLLADGYYGRLKGSYGEAFRGTNLELETKRLGLDIEVFAMEYEYADYHLVKKGTLIKTLEFDGDVSVLGEKDFIEVGLGIKEWAEFTI